eukprot:gene9372-11513_t
MSSSGGGKQNDDGSGSFFGMYKLCTALEKESSHTGKTKIISTFITSSFDGDLYLLAKLMLCKEDKRVYRIKDKAMMKICAHIWDSDLDEMISDLDNGDFTETAKTFYEQYGDHPTRSTLTLKQVDDFLDKLTTVSKFDDQVSVIKQILKYCIPIDWRLICRIIDSDLKINTGAKFFLDALHPQAYDFFKKANNLKLLIEKIKNHDLDALVASKKGGKDKDKSSGHKSLDVAINLMTPIKPMLPKAVKSIDDIISQCSESFFAEIKYDGERIQIHKDGNSYSCFSRNLKPLLPWKVEEVKPYIPKSTKANQIILDGEILLVDTKTGVPLPFGTLSTHKKTGFTDATVCVFLFDILYLNGKSLIHLPITERRKILEQNVTVIKHRIELAEVTTIEGVSDKVKFNNLLNRAISEKLEGLVIKDGNSEYEPGCRHWIKIKKDYLQGMADSADLLVLGGYYGTGSYGGLITVFLLGVYDSENKVYKTLVKASSGIDDKTIKNIQPLLLEKMTKISKDITKIPSWINCTKQYAPDYIIKSYKDSLVLEIESAEMTKSNHHSSGYSMRFPRIIKIRDDKDYKSATNFKELMELAKDAKIGDNDEIDDVRIKSSSTSKTSTTTTTTTTTSTKKSDSATATKTTILTTTSKTSTSSSKSKKIDYVVGDLLDGNNKEKDNCIFILNYIDNSGKFNNKGISGLLGKKWEIVEQESTKKCDSGHVKLFKVEKNNDLKTYVCNLSCIIPPKSKKDKYTLSLSDLSLCLSNVQTLATHKSATVHASKPSLPGVDWNDVEQLLIDKLVNKGIKVSIYSLSSPTTSSSSTSTTKNGTAMDVDEEEDDENLVDNIKKTATTTTTKKLTPTKRPLDEDDDEMKDLEEPIPKPNTPIFLGVNVVFSGIDDKTKTKISNMIKFLGGRVSEKWKSVGAAKTTHLICNSPTDLYRHVERLGGFIVKPEWVNNCFEHDSFLAENLFQYIDETTPNESKELEHQKKKIRESDLPSLFSDCNIYLHPNVNDKETLERYIIAFNGELSDAPGPKTTHIVLSNTGQQHYKFKDVSSKVKIVNSLWIWDSINLKERLDESEFKK